MIGGAGFIGSHVARELISRGVRTRVLAGPPGESRSIDFDVDACVYADIADSRQLIPLLAGSRIVVHAAGPPSVADSFDHEVEYMRVHATGTRIVLDACQRTGVKRIVYLSSAEIYGNPGENAVGESQPTVARSPYGRAKVGGEELVRHFASVGSIEAVVLRLFSVYGPKMSQSSVVAQILAQAARRSCIEVRDVRPVRDFTYVTDIASAIVAACTIPVDKFAIANLGSGIPTSIGELAWLASELAGVPGVRESGEKRPAHNEIVRLIADTRVAARLLNWHASTSLRDGMVKTLEWMRSR